MCHQQVVDRFKFRVGDRMCFSVWDQQKGVGKPSLLTGVGGTGAEEEGLRLGAEEEGLRLLDGVTA